MILKKLQLNNLFSNIRCDITKYTNRKARNIQDKLFAHYCPNCHQVFIARFDWNNKGLYANWQGNYYHCPVCGQRAFATWAYETRDAGTVGFVDKPGDKIPTDMEITLYDYKERIDLIVKSNCINFDPEAPEYVTKCKLKETIQFDIKAQKTWYSQKVDKKDEGPKIEIGNPLDATFTEKTMLYYLQKNTRAWQNQKEEIIELVRTLRTTLTKKLKTVKKYKLNNYSTYIPGRYETGLMVEPIINMAWRLAVTDGPNLKDFFKLSDYKNVNDRLKLSSILLGNVNPGELTEIMHHCQEGLSYPQSALKAFNLADSKSARKNLTKKPIYMLSILKILATANLDEHGQAEFKTYYLKCWQEYENKVRNDETRFFYSLEHIANECIPNDETLTLFNDAVNKAGQKKALSLLKRLNLRELKDTANMYKVLTEDEKIHIWKTSNSPLQVHDNCTELSWRHKHENVNFNIPEHILNRLKMQKDSLKFYLPETYYEQHDAGKELHICVGNDAYKEDVEKGRCNIVLVADDIGKLKACIEIRKNEIIQAKMFKNELAKKDKELNQAINDWANEKGLKINTNDLTKTKKKEPDKLAV